MTTLPPTEATVVLVESSSLPAEQVRATPVVVRRGMAVHTCDGCPAGYIAAVVVDRDEQRITDLLLIRQCRQPDYQLLPITAVT